MEGITGREKNTPAFIYLRLKIASNVMMCMHVIICVLMKIIYICTPESRYYMCIYLFLCKWGMVYFWGVLGV